MIGVIFALIVGFCWAGSGTILKILSLKIDSLLLNTLRLWLAFIGLSSFVFISGRVPDLMSTDQVPFLFVGLSGIFGLTIGDTAYIKSLSFFDVSKAYPIAICSFPVFTLILAILFLEERVTWTTATGALLVLIGIYLVVVTEKRISVFSLSGRNALKGALLSLFTGFMWAASAVTLKKGGVHMDPYVASVIRIVVAALSLIPIFFLRRKKDKTPFSFFGLRNAILIAITAFLAYGIAVVAYVLAIKLLGAGKTALVISTSPILLLIFSVFILKECLTKRALTGILISVAGVYLVII